MQTYFQQGPFFPGFSIGVVVDIEQESMAIQTGIKEHEHQITETDIERKINHE